MSEQRLLDIGLDDVHIDSAGSPEKKPPMPIKARKKLPTRKKKMASPIPGEKPKRRQLRKMALMIDHPQHGRVEVYRMDGKDLEKTYLLQGHGFESDMVLKDGVWIQVAKQGRFFKDGSFFEIDDQAVADIISNFNSTQNKKIPVDFEHASELKGSDGAIPMLGAPAQGWIGELQKRGTQLWAKVEWGQLAKDYIKDGKYKFISPAIRFGTKDTHTGQPTGAKLTSAGLVNIPFLDGMKPLTAKDAETVSWAQEVDASAEEVVVMGSRCFSMSEYMPMIKNCLKMGELSTPTECKDQLDRIREHYIVAGGANSSMGTDIGSYMTAMRGMVGAHMGMSWDDVFDCVDELIEEAMDEHEARYHEGAPQEDMALSAKDDSQPAVVLKDEPEAVASVIEPTNTEATASNNEDTNMTEKALEVQLKDALTEGATLAVQLKDATAKVTELDTAKAKLELQLKEAAAKLATIEAEMVTLKDAHQKRVDAELATEVDNAVAAYGKTKGVVDADKPAMLKLLKADPESFRAIYKPVNASQVALLKDITTPAGNTASEVATETVVATSAVEVDQKALILKYTAEGKTLEQAVGLAYTEATKAHAQATRQLARH